MATATRALVVTKRSGRRPTWRRRRSRGGKRVSLLLVGTLAGTVLKTYDDTMHYPDPTKRNFTTGAQLFFTRLTGFGAAGSMWSWPEFKKAGAPLAFAAVGHMLAGKLGINRTIARAVPLISF